MSVLYNLFSTPPEKYQNYKYVSIKGFLETPQPKSVNDKVGNDESKYVIIDKKNKKTYPITFIFSPNPIQDAPEKYKILYGSYNDGTERMNKNPTTSYLIENFDLLEFKNQTGGKSRRRRQTKNKRKSRRTRRSRK